MIHVSDILNAQKCGRYAWNCRNVKRRQEKFYHLNESFSSLWSRFLHMEDSACGHVNETNAQTAQLLEDNESVRFARFEYKGLRTRIQAIQKTEDGLILFYPYLSAAPRESEIDHIKIDTEIIKRLGYAVQDIYCVYLNKEYVRRDSLDIDRLFLKSGHLFNRRGKPCQKTIMEMVDEIEIDLDDLIEKTNSILSSPAMAPERTKACTAGRKCIYYEDCFDDAGLPDDSTLFLTTSKNKLEAYNAGAEHIKDMDPDLFEGTPLQYAQYMASRKERPFCDYFALSAWNEQIEFPISYLDFEWDTFPIPPYDEMKPFDVLCFQYSLHVEQKDGTLSHMDFFSTGDCRKHFVESVLDNIPKTGTVLVYNMEGAEKLRLQQLGQQFPEYADRLEQICSRMIDLSRPFEHGVYYNSAMRGHYSLKNLLPVFSQDYTYKDLEISDGMNAVFAYRNYDHADAQQQQIIQHAIRVYCMMDTYAEYVVYHGLLDHMRQLEKEMF
ncbi:DUF2779 domain-containing protein [uncultured Dubosiella sp.]|uniref:DUF2779 domain-containing protein n=1 Tax=uncultured Dubosiella sp. TaxID=1937011 RepID=UPI0020831795|nr:DUF2779 domain-containing protein [uncultured Dubosiella sp.]GJM57755.1 hypothetical protein EROP_14480 [Erysipelotrichaceae bacterium OPF54]